MDVITLTLICNLTSFITAAGAVLLAYHGRDGWGWMLFVAVLLHSWPKVKA